METKNIIIQNYANSVLAAANSIINTSATLNNNADENAAIIKTLNVLVESIRSQTVLLQGALDTYNE